MPRPSPRTPLVASALVAALATAAERPIGASAAGATLAVIATGPAELRVVDAGGRVAATLPREMERTRAIPGARVDVPTSGVRRVTLPAEPGATYSIEVEAAADRLARLTLSYEAGPARVTREYLVPGQDSPVALQVTLRGGPEEPLDIRFALPPPEGLRLERTGEAVELAWDAPPGLVLAGYGVYARAPGAPVLELLGFVRSPAMSLAEAAPGTEYAVTARDALGRESVLSSAAVDGGGPAGTRGAAGSDGVASRPIAGGRGNQMGAAGADEASAAGAAGSNGGGLIALPAPRVGRELQSNGSFEQGGNVPVGWSTNGLVRDASVARTGGASFRLQDANLLPRTQSAWQVVNLPRGSYRIGGWVRLQDVARTRGNGVRLRLSSPAGSADTRIVRGTSDWQYLEARHILLTEDARAELRLEGHGEPDGTAWFDDVELREEEPLPVDVFMLHPGYRGLLFSDESWTLRFEVAVAPPEGAGGDLQVEAALLDEATGDVRVRGRFRAADRFTARVPALGLSTGRAYRVRFRLLRGDEVLYEHPGYRIVPTPAAARESMTFSFDEHGRILVRGEPTFLLGVYDSGMGYVNAESRWDELLGGARRLFDLPINIYLNYWYGGAPPSAMLPMMSALQRRGIVYLQTSNCFNESFRPDFPTRTDDDYVRALAGHPGLGGFYTADECDPGLAPAVFAQYERLRVLDPDGLTFAALRPRPNVRFWRDAVDLLATDAYPLFGREPAGGYPLHEVADGVRLAREAVHGARPFGAVIQFFQSTANARWPTREELRSMSYMAIAEGANAIFYWSLGANALAYVCNGWCDRKVEYFGRLRAVMRELDELQPALSGTDAPSLLAANSRADAIRTRVKVSGGRAWLIAVNLSRESVSAELRLARDPGRVEVHGEGRQVSASRGRFTDTFRPYEAHVYAFSNP